MSERKKIIEASATFSDRLRAAMELRQITGAELARRMSTPQSTVQRWLAGSVPRSRMLEDLANVLLTTPDFLLHGRTDTQSGTLAEAHGEYTIPQVRGGIDAIMDNVSFAKVAQFTELALSASQGDPEMAALAEWLMRYKSRRLSAASAK